MKAYLLLLLGWVLAVPVFAQINFEEVSPPEDFALRIIRQSPSGEQFVQAFHQLNIIYSSTDGQNWTATELPAPYFIENIRFLGDETPVITTLNGPHLIWRENSWHTMSVPGAAGLVRASFIKEDTLFAYQDRHFAYSIDAGENFEPLFEVADNWSGDHMDVWKLGSDYVLTYDAEVNDSLIVFDPEGALLLQEALQLQRPDRIFNSCGELLILTVSSYYRLEAGTLSFELGLAEDFFPGFQSELGRRLDSYSEGYYLKQGEALYRTTPCTSDWELVLIDPLIDNDYDFSVDTHGNVIFYDTYRNSCIYYDAQADTLGVRDLTTIDYALPYQIDEHSGGQQAVLTTNGVYLKGVEDTEWSQNREQLSRAAKYSPDGRLYVYAGNDNLLLRSSDNGVTFELIDLPQVSPGSAFEVPEDDVLVLVDNLQFRVHYSLDDGASWSQVELVSELRNPDPVVVKKGNYITILSAYVDLFLFRINTLNNTLERAPLDGVFAITTNFQEITITEDGAIYFWGSITGNPGLYRYVWGEEPELILPTDDLDEYHALVGAGDQLFAVNGTNVFLLDGSAFTALTVTGLPEEPVNYTRRFLAESGHLYLIIDSHRIFRSTAPLEELMPTSTQQINTVQTISVHPNPAQKTLQLSMAIPADAEIVVIDQLGRLVHSWQRLSGNRLDVSSLKSGVYQILLLQKGNRSARATFVKQ